MDSFLVDIAGNPLQRDDLHEQQTAALSWLKHTVAGHPTRGLTPEKLARILQMAEIGQLIDQAWLFEDMEEKDAHLLAELSKRKMAVIGLGWSIKAPRNPSAAEQQLADDMAELFQELPDFSQLLFDMLDAIGKGYSRIEMNWEQTPEGCLPKSFDYRDPAWFMANPEDRNQITLRDGTYTGGILRPFGWISHDHKAKSGYMTRAGLFRCLVWPWMFKNMALRDLAEFLEIYGIPPRIAKYPPGASEKEKATLLRAVTMLGHNAAGMMPQGMTIDFMAAAEGTGDPFELMMNRCDAMISKAILGGTLTSSTDGVGSQALGNVHNEVRIDIRNADARQLANTLSRDLIYPLAVLNSSTPVDPRRCPRFEFDTRDPDDMKLYSEALPALVNMGLRIGTNYVYDKLCIPVPAEGDEVLIPSAAAAPAPTALRRAALTRQLAVTDEIDGLTDAMGDEWQRVVTPVRDQLAALISECKDLQELKRRLPELGELLDVEELQKQIAEGAFVARFFGRAVKA
jgi:phage gp29-like protein